VNAKGKGIDSNGWVGNQVFRLVKERRERDGSGPMKLDWLNDGVIAAGGAGGGAIDPGSERSGGLAQAGGV